MKKRIVTIALLVAFLNTQCYGVIAATANNKNNQVKNNNNSAIKLSKRKYQKTNYYVENQGVYDDEVDLDLTPKEDAFANNYQHLNKNKKYPELSQVEGLFNGKEVDITETPLMQVGYDLFTAPIAGGANTGKFDDSYKLSVGEKVSAYLFGDSADIAALSGSKLLSPVVQTEVDSNGNIFITGLGVVPAENKTIKEVENAMNKMASAKFDDLKIKLNVSSGQDFSVFVYGQVNRPGKVLINSNSSIIDALGAAGGVKKTGTLRQISYTSGKKQRTVDLYKTIFSGNDDDIILKANDKIFVGGIGNVVAFKNGVSVPGIYETKDGESLQKLIGYAGGIMPGTQTDEVILTSLDNATKERSAKNVTWTEVKNTKLTSGDIIEFRDLYNTAENTVTIQGNIKHPGTFAYKQGMRLSDVLKSEKELLEETFITQAVIRRVSGQDNTIQTIPIFLKEFFAGVNDPVLQPRDIINIYKNTNTDFVDIYGCISTPKHLTYIDDMRLDDVLTDIQFVDSDIKQDGEVNVAFKTDGTALVGGTSNYSKVISAENVAVEILSQDNTTQVYYLYDIMVNGNTIHSISLMPGDKVFFRNLRDNEIIKNVKVTGFVNHPGVYKFIEGKNLVEMIDMAGGLHKDADLRGTVFVRKNIRKQEVDLAKQNNERDIELLQGRLASGFKQSSADMQSKANMIDMFKADEKTYNTKYTGQIALNIKNNNLARVRKSDNLEVQDGDEIYIPRMPQHVTVLGEVYNEKSFAYIDGMKVRGYIKQVGRYTPNASKFRLYKVGVNGRAVKAHGWTKVAKGDTIVVPRKIAGNDWITPVCGTLQSIASVLSTAFIITKWNK